MRMPKQSDGRVASCRRSGGIGIGGNNAGLELLADIAVAVSDCEELCGCGHSDPRTCFFTVKKRKSLFLQTHHSLLHRDPRNPPIKLAIKQKSNSRHSFPLQNPINPPIKLVFKHKPLPVQQPSGVKVSVFPPSPAVEAPVSLPLPRQPFPAIILPSTVSSAAVPRQTPVGFAAPLQEEFPLSLRARVSATVGGEGVCSLDSKFCLVIRKQLEATDLRPGNCRLSIPGRQISNEFLKFLTNEETRELEMGRKIKLGFFLDPDFQIAAEGCRLCRWMMGKSEVYNVIGRGWGWVLRKKERKLLKMNTGDEMELWSFRTVNSGELCFVFIAADTRRRAAAETELGEQEAEVTSMVMIENGSQVDHSSHSSTLTHQEQEEQQHSALDLSLRL